MIGDKSISAVLFVFNEQKFIGEMLESVRNQTVPVDKIIVVDDQSTDATPAIIQSYREMDDRIEYHLNPKKGKIHAYQLGLSKVTTDLFFISAGDDVLSPQFVSRMFYDVLEKNNVRYGYANCTITDQDLKPLQTIAKKSFYTPDELLVANHTNGYLFGYRSVISEITPLPDSLRFEDWYTAVKLSVLYGKNLISGEPLFFYRRHGGNATALGRSRSRYLGSVNRNITFYESLLASSFLQDGLKKQVIELLEYYRFLSMPGIRSSLRVIATQLSARQKIRVVINPIWLRLKYYKP